MAELFLGVAAGAAAIYLGWKGARKVARKAGSAYKSAKQEMYAERGLLDYDDPYGYYSGSDNYYSQPTSYYPPQSSHHYQHQSSRSHREPNYNYGGNSYHSSRHHSYY